MIKFPVIIKERDIPSVEDFLSDAQSSKRGVLTVSYGQVLGIQPIAYDILSERLSQVQASGVKVKEINLNTKLKGILKNLEYRDREEYDANE